ncbi:hypothetical protein [Thermanaerothrix daxensis]|nr:hypothetical protein [Thermanaerothrix daxensis]
MPNYGRAGAGRWRIRQAVNVSQREGVLFWPNPHAFHAVQISFMRFIYTPTPEWTARPTPHIWRLYWPMTPDMR